MKLGDGLATVAYRLIRMVETPLSENAGQTCSTLHSHLGVEQVWPGVVSDELLLSPGEPGGLG